MLKLLPLIVTVAPTAPDTGLKSEIEGEGKTVKFVALTRAIPLVVKDILPVVAPAGTVVVIVVASEVITVAGVPLNASAVIVLKLLPLIVTDALSAPLDGVNPDSVGVGNTVKLVALTRLIPLVVNDILPVVAPAGTEVVIVVASDEITVAGVPLKARSDMAPKFVPLMVTEALTAPLEGVNPVRLGVGNTLKSVALTRLIPLVVKEIFPVVAPAGTVVIIVEASEELTVADVLLNSKAVIVPKLVPEIVTETDTAPLDGVNPVIVGVGNTVKSPELVTVTPLVVTEILPVVAPGGTEVVIEDEVEAVTVAVVPLKSTTFSAGVVLKFAPLIVTEALTAPLVGVKPEIDGVGNTVKFDPLVAVTPLTVTEIGPVVAPTGTVVVILVGVDADTTAGIPLN